MARKQYINVVWDEYQKHWTFTLRPPSYRSGRHEHYAKKLNDALIMLYQLKDKNYQYAEHGVRIFKDEHEYKVRNRYDQNERLMMTLCYGP